MARKKSATKKAREAAAREAAAAAAATNTTTTTEEQSKQSSLKQNNNIPSSSDLSDNGESSDSDNEDDFGELITEDVEQGINEVLNAIKNNETNKLLDPNVKFFNENDVSVPKVKKEKPIYLKDYHRMNILSGNALKSDDEMDQDDMQTIDGQKSFVTQQRDERNQLLDEIKNAINDEGDNDNGSDDDDDDGFLKKKETKQSDKGKTSTTKISKENDEEFLNEFMSQQAWIPQSGDKVINLDNQDDEEFENAAEEFENAYNFRYEDPNAAEIISYARNQATLRRSDSSTRRRKRDQEKAEKQSIKMEKETKVQKKKIKKINKLTDVLEQLQKEFGAKIEDHMVEKITKTLMNSDYKENEWDNVIAELFNEEFYNDESGKPTWNDDDEEDFNMMADEDEAKEDAEEEVEADDEEEAEKESQQKDENAPSKKSKKAIKHVAKKEKKKLVEMVENAVEANKLAIIDEVENERGRSKNRDDDEIKFRYREVSPESFGLTTREIFAADDADLNEFISLKKFAPYRGKELRNKDKRKVTKARRIKEWKKKTFNNENGPTFDGVWLPKDEESKDSKKQHNHHHHNKHNHSHNQKDRIHKKSKK